MRPSLPRWSFWLSIAVASTLTLTSLGLRTLRWIFLLRRSEIRIPIRDAYIAYLAGFTLLLAPFLLGEIAIRAFVHKQRGRVPVAVSVVANLWERLLDTVALAAIAGIMTITLDGVTPLALGMLAAVISVNI